MMSLIILVHLQHVMGHEVYVHTWQILIFNSNSKGSKITAVKKLESIKENKQTNKNILYQKLKQEYF